MYKEDLDRGPLTEEEQEEFVQLDKRISELLLEKYEIEKRCAIGKGNYPADNERHHAVLVELGLLKPDDPSFTQRVLAERQNPPEKFQLASGINVRQRWKELLEKSMQFGLSGQETREMEAVSNRFDELLNEMLQLVTNGDEGGRRMQEIKRELGYESLVAETENA